MHKFVILRIYSISPHIAVIYSHKNSQPPAGAKVGLCRQFYRRPRSMGLLHCQNLGFSGVSTLSKVRVTVWIRVTVRLRFSFIGAKL